MLNSDLKKSDRGYNYYSISFIFPIFYENE